MLCIFYFNLKMKKGMNNFMPISMSTWMKWTNFLKDTDQQGSLKKIYVT